MVLTYRLMEGTTEWWWSGEGPTVGVVVGYRGFAGSGACVLNGVSTQIPAPVLHRSRVELHRGRMELHRSRMLTSTQESHWDARTVQGASLKIV